MRIAVLITLGLLTPTLIAAQPPRLLCSLTLHTLVAWRDGAPQEGPAQLFGMPGPRMARLTPTGPTTAILHWWRVEDGPNKFFSGTGEVSVVVDAAGVVVAVDKRGRESLTVLPPEEDGRRPAVLAVYFVQGPGIARSAIDQWFGYCDAD